MKCAHCWSTALTLALALSAAGCSYIPFFGGSDNKPRPLPEIKASVTARILWQASTDGRSRLGFAPAVAADKLYAASPNGTLSAFDLASGKQQWRVSAAPRLSTGVGAGAGIVVVGTAKGEVMAFDSAGKARWTSKVSSEILSPPQVSDQVVAVWSGDGRIYGLSTVDGKRLWVWQQSTPSLIVRNYAGGVLTRGALFTGLPGGKMLALDASTGAVGWEANVSTPKGTTELERIADVTSLPAYDEREVCAVAYQGRAACFELARGTLVWTRDLSSFAGVAMDNRYFYITDDKGNIQALDKATGASVWKQDKIATRHPTGPQVLGDYLAVGDFQGYVHLMNRNDGSLVGRIATDGTPAVAQPVRAGDGVVLQSKAGTVYRIAAP